MGWQPGEMAFASLQGWWKLLKRIPDDLARMLQPPWGYQGITGLGNVFWLIPSGWKSACASRTRGRRVCLRTGLVPRRNFVLARRENKKSGVFPLEFGGNSLLSWKPEPP